MSLNFFDVAIIVMINPLSADVANKVLHQHCHIAKHIIFNAKWHLLIFINFLFININFIIIIII